MDMQIKVRPLPLEREQAIVDAVGGFSRTGEFLLIPVEKLSDLRKVLKILRRYIWKML